MQLKPFQMLKEGFCAAASCFGMGETSYIQNAYITYRQTTESIFSDK